ncbi:hemagglutinin repeat-containing protein, partial [Stenotrophomonas maltophilia]|uniref:hemagglutinin repeat-containing protein n=1 Tax=Stenotrophomonas maltophilia TaxID=40324 RepID=UPI0015DE58BD
MVLFDENEHALADIDFTATITALAARDNITLRSEAEDHTQSSKNKSGSGEIGFSIGA